jgi:hypothetical protein
MPAGRLQEQMKITAATALAVWAVGTAWLVLFVILEHFDEDGPDLVDYIQWGSIVLPLAFFPYLRRRFAVWLDKQRKNP